MDIDILGKIQDAEMILIGIGEEFDNTKILRKKKEYAKVRSELEESDAAWMIPALNRIYGDGDNTVRDVLNRLAERISDKNYFVISTSTNDIIRDISWQEGRLIMPCGGSRMKQCMQGCEHGLTELDKSDWLTMREYLDNILTDTENSAICLGYCPDCGKPLVLNNIYTEKYDENGYLKQWSVYTKWLQTTLNRKLLILELGVGMQYPSVIRWPFEKIAFY